MIDEIGLHLHPCWQISVIENLQRVFPKCQFFISTNSPLVVSSVNVKKGNKLITVSNGGSTEITRNLYGSESDRILTDIFQMKSLRNPEVQFHINKVWECFYAKDIDSPVFNTEMQWLEEYLNPADSFFIQASLQKALINKQLNQ